MYSIIIEYNYDLFELFFVVSVSIDIIHLVLRCHVILGLVAGSLFDPTMCVPHSVLPNHCLAKVV